MLFGGAAGPGKSTALLMAALEFVDRPGYAAMLFRRTYTDLALPGALMDVAGEWLGGTAAHWNGVEKTWTFPSGATLTFGYLESERDKYRYQGAELDFCGFDELTQFKESQYRYLFSRLRRSRGSTIPIRMRSASNPGGVGHHWVSQRFMVERHPDRRFVPAVLEDNPYLDREEYEHALRELDPVTYRQLRHGDWWARSVGDWFKASNFLIVDAAPAQLVRVVRWWDLAATKPEEDRDPDWTVGVKMGRSADGLVWVLDVARFRGEPAEVERRIQLTAEMDGRLIEQHFEREPGAAGKIVGDYYRRRVLAGWPVWSHRITGQKQTRVKPWAAAVDGQLVRLVRAPWTREFIEEHEAFPQAGVHDDQVDAASGAYSRLFGAQDWARAYGVVRCAGCGTQYVGTKPERACPRCGRRHEAA